MASIRRLPRKHSLALLLFLATAALYLNTLAPSITQRHFGVDGPELAATVYTMGVAHPPGYPTYLILAKGFSLLLPWGDIGHRTSVFSALCGAGAVVLVFYISHLLMESIAGNTRSSPRGASTASFIAAAAFAVSPLLWSQSVITEVYSLNALFTGGVILLLLHWARGAGKGSWPLLLAGLALGLGMGNHLTLAFLFIPTAYYLVLHRDTLTPRRAAGFLGLLVLGLAVYLYLPLRAAQNPPINWGDADSLEGLIWTVSARPYRDLAFGLPLPDLPGRLIEWADLLLRQFTAAGLLLGVLGAWRLRVHRSPALVLLGLVFLSSTIYSLMYYTPDARVYLIPAFLVFSLWIGLGLYWLLSMVDAYRGRLPSPLSSALAVVTLLAVPGLSLLLNFQDISIRDDRESIDYARGVFQRVEPDAVVIADTEEELFPLWYYSYVVKRGRGPVVISTRLVQFDWYLQGQHKRHPEVVPAGVAGPFWSRLARIVEHNLERRPVYITTGANALLSQFEGQEEDGLHRLVRRLD